MVFLLSIEGVLAAPPLPGPPVGVHLLQFILSAERSTLQDVQISQEVHLRKYVNSSATAV
jgi:hypothetical protein